MKKRMICAVMTLIVILSLIPAALAENVCQKISGTGKPSESVTFTVKTNKHWGKNDLVISQDKGKAEVWWGDDCDAYGRYTVTYTNSDGKEKSRKLTGDSVTLDLKPNQTYTVKVTAYDYQSLHLLIDVAHGGFKSWVTTPVWTVSAQENITLCQ